MPPLRPPDDSLTPVEWAWCAGLFEGEGTIALTSYNGVQVAVAMTDRDVVERLDALWPAPHGVRERARRAEHHKQSYIWKLSTGSRVRGFLEGIYPHLGVRRRARVEEALARLEHNTGAKALWTHCPRGHKLSGDNVYVNAKKGRRACKTCARERQRGTI